MKKAIITIFILALLIGAGYYLWQNRHDFFFQGELENIKEENQEAKPEEKNDQTEPSDFNNGNETGEEMLDADYFIKDKEKACKNNCEDVKEELEEYCREICGLNEGTYEEEEYKEKDCEDLSGLERDICYKRKAIEANDDTICENIEDSELEDNCKHRVLEDILEEDGMSAE